MKFYVTGDKHGDFVKCANCDELYNEDNGIIILGDAGFNFFGGINDTRTKEKASRYPCTWYAIMGNHDMRSQDVPTMKMMYDDNVGGHVYYEEEFPKIRYFKDFGIYTINGYTCGIIGHAYSVDKFYRLSQGWTWHADEQLTADEMEQCSELFKHKKFDFILTHTCPISWQPTDLFLSQVNQSEVDSTMEQWLDEIKDSCQWKHWLFGHYHQDRLERPYVEMFYHDIASLDSIVEKWNYWDKWQSLEEWWTRKSPKFYMGVDR